MTPAVRNAVATKERILDAAFCAFSEHGFFGTRVDDIAAKASVNKALLYHYYADKEALFESVLECKMAQLSKLRIDPDRFAECAGEFFDFYAANPWLARLMQWEALNFGTKPVPNEAARAGHFAERVAEIVALQRAGKIDASLDAKQTLVTLIGVVTAWFTCPQTARMITGGDPYAPKALKQRRKHVVDVARRLLEVR
jgi:AcrR family transcriptional regulator